MSEKARLVIVTIVLALAIAGICFLVSMIL